jgi:hypothetical protein
MSLRTRRGLAAFPLASVAAPSLPAAAKEVCGIFAPPRAPFDALAGRGSS